MTVNAPVIDCYQLLYFSWLFINLLAIQEPTNSFTILIWGWISCFGLNNLWNSMTVLSASWFTYCSSSHYNLFCDNKSALYLDVNPVFHECSKHIEINCHVVREKVCDGVLRLLPINTKSQVIDICTKSLIPKLWLQIIIMWEWLVIMLEYI